MLISQAADPGHQISPANAVWQGYNHSQWTHPHKFVKEEAGGGRTWTLAPFHLSGRLDIAPACILSSLTMGQAKSAH